MMKKIELKKFSSEIGINSKLLDMLILKELNITKSSLFLIDEIDDKYIENIKLNLEKLKNGVPIEYIINNAEFYNLDFYVDNRVLIPRNDTEIMVDNAIDSIFELELDTLIDIGTGSSCIAISIMENTKNINHCFVGDISEKALEVSKKNINKYQLDKKIKQIHSNLITEFLSSNSYDIGKNVIITANLPYIKNGDHENMDIETILYEPELALYGGKETGFELYEQLLRECIQFKKIQHLNKLVLFIEIGFDQYDYSYDYLKNLNLQFEYFKDNNGINRCIKIVF
ncbi:MAG: peptide chain release factor N(5)-glutamine methyltransferase [Candidatus Gracilibacteria bacterium]|nr:peptide chain release factor N(5)-glutamine methyltransferase [Candidatus Gracilibacteria bacterium]